ncbi:MFS transporter [Amycolatopsis sp. NPDC059027]|uniref:MFS transporter n=1 Tax=Amycolatopsis sp. NPDC059027 TaxID=3346709 RepID=UPI00366B67F4
MTVQYTSTVAPPHRGRWLALSALLLAEAMNLLDATITQVASPAIRADLGVSDGQLQWVSAGYTCPFAVLLITGGRIGDILGRRRAFVLGTAAFVVCSALCAFAPGIGFLLAARAVQGASAALIIPQTFGLIRAMFDGAERAKALGTIGPVMALASVCGPVLGGVLTDADILGSGWRAVFLVNVPLGLLVLLATPLVLEDRSPTRPRLDVAGTALAAVSTGLMIYPLVQGNDAGWAPWIWLCLLAGVALFAVFVRHQTGKARRGGSPLVEPGLFRDRVFPASLVSSLLFFAVMNGLMFVLVVFFQLGGRTGALGAGLGMLPWSAGLAIGSWCTGRYLVPRFGARVMRVALLVLVAGLAGTVMLVDAPWPVLLWPLLVSGVGLGMFTVPFFTNALSRVDHHETGSASGLLNAAQQFGATAGVAVLGAAFFHLDGVGGTRLALGISLGMLALVLALTRPMLRRR